MHCVFADPAEAATKLELKFDKANEICLTVSNPPLMPSDT